MCENTLKFKSVNSLSYVYYMHVFKHASMSLLELNVMYKKNNDICSWNRENIGAVYVKSISEEKKSYNEYQ